MLEFLYPREYLGSVREITPQKLSSLGIDTLLFDIDNTIVPYWIRVPDEGVKAYFKSLKDGGIKAGVLSNSREERSRDFCAPLGIPYVYRAGKPGIGGFKRLIEKMGSVPQKTALVGDQIFTDVWCANKAGAYSILVKQVSPKDELVTAPKRPFEKIVLKFYLRREAKK